VLTLQIGQPQGVAPTVITRSTKKIEEPNLASFTIPNSQFLIPNFYKGVYMARITVEDCLEKVPNRFMIVHMVSQRVRQIREGSEYLVNSPKNEDIVVALREIAAGKVVLKDIPK